MSLGGLVDKILVYRSCSHGFDPSYGTSSFSYSLFDHTHMHICVFGFQRVKYMLLKHLATVNYCSVDYPLQSIAYLSIMHAAKTTQ